MVVASWESFPTSVQNQIYALDLVKCKFADDRMQFVVVLPLPDLLNSPIYRKMNVNIDVFKFLFWTQEPGPNSHQIEFGHGNDVLAMKPLVAHERKAIVLSHPNLIPIMLNVASVRKRAHRGHQPPNEIFTDDLLPPHLSRVQKQLTHAGIFGSSGVKAGVVALVTLVVDGPAGFFGGSNGPPDLLGEPPTKHDRREQIGAPNMKSQQISKQDSSSIDH